MHNVKLRHAAWNWGGKEEGEKLLKEVKVMSFSTMSNVHKAKYNMCVIFCYISHLIYRPNLASLSA